MSIENNLKKIKNQINNIDPNIRILGATKHASVEQINISINQGLDLIGENTWQDSKYKLPKLLSCEKHFIGHLQTNKVKFIINIFDCIESVDSIKLAEKINKEAEKNNIIYPIMLEVNISQDKNKYGFSPDEMGNVLKKIKSNNKNIKLIGLMTITAKEQEEKKQNDFKKMKEIFTKYKNQYNLKELSMGMSADYLIAAKEGATIVRIGSAIFNN